ncbi:uncharacterized protein F4812DRAFT_462751 [Daldinia caldariorum]|uniref:uncharacterized protein n=1 Tax=Daldinia caldariorum TaxID=326644 RepID=UPI00200765E3|nr:uncharacterized protein F4812DRAFT_462751 [Daldinia caldariorum]KAI1464336.1 hypothetical protein F4812DRAFT_462751 [Daldinia caldariorum]
MHSSSSFALALAICGGVVALAVPSSTIAGPATPVAAAWAPSDSPDCTTIEEYCKCKDDDFQCETNPNCEWCRDHNAWGDQNPTSSAKA